MLIRFRFGLRLGLAIVYMVYEHVHLLALDQNLPLQPSDDGILLMTLVKVNNT